MPDTQTIESVDITPSWTGVARVIEAVLRNGTVEGIKSAEAELLNMARLADRFVALAKEPSSDAPDDLSVLADKLRVATSTADLLAKLNSAGWFLVREDDIVTDYERERRGGEYDDTVAIRNLTTEPY